MELANQRILSLRSLMGDGRGGWVRRSGAVMQPQSKALTRLKVLILALTAFLLAFSISGFVLLDVYLLSSVSETRLGSIDRTRSYLQPFVRTVMMLRNLHLAGNQTTGAVVPGYRSSISSTANNMLVINTLNFVSPPSQAVADFLLRRNLAMSVPVPGTGGFVAQPANFLDFISQCVSSLLTASTIDLADLQNADYSVDGMTVNKRAVLFLCAHLS
jgi:hypothetical protein